MGLSSSGISILDESLEEFHEPDCKEEIWSSSLVLSDMDLIVLEDWLRVASSSVYSAWSSTQAAAATAAPQFPANAIVHGWAQIRAFVQQRKALTSADSEPFQLLNQHRRSLHLADSQAKLLQALLSEVSSGDVALIGFVRKFAVLGLLAWIRKSYSPTGGTTAGGATTSIKQLAPEALASVVQSILKAMEERPLSDQYTCEVILLLGTISNLENVAEAVRIDCLTSIAQQLRGRRDVISREGAIAEALAGAGYAMAGVSSPEHQAPIFQGLLLLWTQNPEVPSGAERMEDRGSFNVELDNTRTSRGQDDSILKDQFMLLHLLDFLGSNFLSRENSQSANGNSNMDLMHDAMLKTLENNCGMDDIQCTSIMVSVGLLRSLYRWDQGNKKRGISSPVHHKWLSIMGNLENIVIKICEQAVTPDMDIFSTFIAGPLPGPSAVFIVQPGKQNLCRRVSVAVSRCRGLPPHPSILRCLLFSLFGDALSLHTLYSVFTFEQATGSFGSSQQFREESASQEEKVMPTGNGGDLSHSLQAFQAHVDSFFLKEIGAIARAMCDQYQVTSGDLRGQIEHLVADYARNMYERHRLLVAVTQTFERHGWSHYRQTLEKVLESAFITVVIFFSLAVKEPGHVDIDIAEAEVAALALDSLSCVEYFRHVQLREFTRVVQRSVTQIARSEVSSVVLARLFPAYGDIIKKPGTPDLNLSVGWGKDEVQTARLLFYFRVLPLCLIKMPEATFAAEIAPVIILYLQHPSETVSKASHALFAAFLSLGVRSESPVLLGAKKSESTSSIRETQITLREQLVVYYTDRALQAFPGLTPFEGLVAGAGAIARQLPPGSPATVYCLKCLVEKTETLYSVDGNSRNTGQNEGKQSQKGIPGEISDQHRNISEEEVVSAAQKLQILLLHMCLLVDLQVLPVLLKFMAKLILGLPKHFRIVALAEAYDVVGCTNDYTRKPTIVPWLQSLSFLSSRTQSMPNETPPLKGEDKNNSETRSVKVSNPESSSKSKSVDVTTPEQVVGETIDDGKENSNVEAVVEGKKVAPSSEVRLSRDISARSLVSDNEECSTEQARLNDEGLELRSKL